MPKGGRARADSAAVGCASPPPLLPPPYGCGAGRGSGGSEVARHLGTLVANCYPNSTLQSALYALFSAGATTRTY